MRILLVGGLSVNPERFLPLIRSHEVYGLWESDSRWGVSLKAGGPYSEITTLTIEQIGNKKIDIVWVLISPWDGTQTILKIKKRYPKLPIVRMIQGGLTPWWHQGSKTRKRSLNAIGQVIRGNYDFLRFKKSTELCDGVMFNAPEYRLCAIDQGVELRDKPHLIANGMAFNYDLLAKGAILKLSALDKKPHVALIGRAQHNPKLFLEHGVHLHYHSISPLKLHKYAHKERYLGDISLLRQSPISIAKIFNFKKEIWYKTFSRYDAGIMPFIGFRKIDFHKGVDINIPGRVNTYILAGIPPIVSDAESAILNFLRSYSDEPYFITFKDLEELLQKIHDKAYLAQLQKNLSKVRVKFSMQHELKYKIIPFLQTFI